MTWLAFLIAVAYVPGWTGVSIPTGWAAMSLTLPWVAWGRTRTPPLHWLGAAFLLYAFVSIAWAPRADDAINELWHLSILAFAFLLGSRVDVAPIWRGLAIGCGVSSAVALVQWWGGIEWQILPTSDWAKPPGLFYNNAVAGAVAAIVVIANRQSLWAWAGLPLLLLSQSRGAWLAVAATIFLTSRWLGRIALVLAAVPLLIYYWPHLHTDTDGIRYAIWFNIAERLTWFGHGAGSLMSVFASDHGQLFHIEHAHNDYLSLAFTYGSGALPFFALVVVLLTQRHHREWPVLVCCSILASYFWILSSPVPAFAFAVAAGRICANLDVAWADVYRWGLGIVLRHGASTARLRGAWRKAIPI